MSLNLLLLRFAWICSLATLEGDSLQSETGSVMGFEDSNAAAEKTDCQKTMGSSDNPRAPFYSEARLPLPLSLEQRTVPPKDKMRGRVGTASTHRTLLSPEETTSLPQSAHSLQPAPRGGLKIPPV